MNCSSNWVKTGSGLGDLQRVVQIFDVLTIELRRKLKRYSRISDLFES